MIQKIRHFLWRILGIDYKHALQIHDYIFLKKDRFCKLGNRTYDNGALVWRWTNAPLIIGNYCSIANNVRFIMDEGFHKASEITSFPIINNHYKDDSVLPGNINKKLFLDTIKQRQGITIGNDVWIGMNSIIMPGVSIGNGVTIAANSIVTKSVDDFMIVGGNPAKPIKQKHNDSVIKQLNAIAWWNWSDKTVKERAMDFYQSTENFIKIYGK
ncbi:CatB-related O-acetyltransferase [Aquimarina intermedia]|uniref:Virginiamycin A acetyltransferase n=1 Tax=Aquimarina intermedia TaxID=350814 RepID=A0A5S5CAX5_9FLAO|nr:CatB-related O-acetyltransferase [Aquimarina intermedia]TYP75143.1 virginiamycin A acetyltransferase [Aquimarina intermedia]